ncbi:MAG: small multi-drug export protein, partial [Thermoplasmata archaeon]
MDIAAWFINTLSGLPPWAVVIFISMLPFIELRGAIPAAMFIYNMAWYEAFIFSVIGNMIPVPFILRYMNDIERFFRRWKIFNRFFDWLFARTRKRAKEKIEKYGYF